MASLQDVPDLIEDIRLAFAESEGIWETLEKITDRSQSSGDSHEFGYLFQWFGETLDSLDNTCETLKNSEGSDWEVKLEHLDKGRLKLSLLCHHIEGSERVSFDTLISQKAIAVCSYVTRVIFFKCFLFISGIALEKFKDTESGSGHMSRLTDRLSSLSNKWNWSNTDSCEDGVLDIWHESMSSEDEPEDAMKLLYQWVLAPLSQVTGPLITREMDMLPDRVDDLSAVAFRAKWGEELCELLQTLDEFFIDSKTVEFLYEPFSEWHCYTAERLLDLGNCKRARELLDLAQKKLEGIDDKMMVPEWRSNQLIKFHPVNPLRKLQRMDRVLSGLFRATGQESYRKDVEENYTQMHNKVKETWGSDFEKYVSDERSSMSVFDHQLNDIQELVWGERYSEAEQKFKQLDPETCRCQGTLRRFLEHLHSRGLQSLSWGSFCEKQNLLLGVSEDLGDRQLTAIFLQRYGIIIGCRSLSRLPKQYRWRPRAYGIEMIDELADAGAHSSLELWLKEELNLQFPSPAPDCVREVISCLRDPCDVGEHKRELPAMLKACRLLKRSIDIYSDLLHNWTQGFSDEAEWLQLLELQKFVHDTLKSYLLVIYHFYRNLLLENHNVTTLYQPDPPVNTSGSALEACMAFMTSALVWVERGRTRSLLSQLGPWYSMIKHGDANHSLKDELIRFDRDEQAATRDIFVSCRMACKPGSKPLFVEYVNLGDMYVAFTMEDQGVDEPFYMSCQEAFRFTAEDLGNLPDGSERLQTLAGEDLADDALTNLPDEDLEKLADPKTVNKLLFVFYKIIPRQQKSNKECVVAKLHSILEKLYDILIRPFWERSLYHLRDPYAPVVFVPDKMLYRVPFALLRDKKTKKYLFELHTISIAPSLRVLQHCARRRDDLQSFPLKQECILAVGNPTYAEEKDLLPGTGTELMLLRDCFQGRIKILEEREATRANFLELVKEASFSEDRPVFALMHLGVHGHWSENKSHKTGSLQFAPPQTADICTEHLRTGQSHTSELEAQESWKDSIQARDGRERYRSAFGEVGAITRTNSSASDSVMLPSEDIIGSGFQWRTHLAVLSACNSSRGQDYYDGEINLPRALMISGVPSAVVSQWKIDDDASPVLMKALYDRLQNGESVASALQSAMTHIRECKKCCYQPDSAQNIFQWGSFVVWGLPSVTLPGELYHESGKVDMTLYGKVNLLLASADNICALDKSAVDDAISAVELILSNPAGCEASFISDVVKAYTLIPLEDISRVEHFLETKDRYRELFSFRRHMMFAQAMEGSPEKALECIEVIIAHALSHGASYDGSMLQLCRQERAVIWRLMDKYEMALEEFNALLALEEDYECLIQMSYLKHLMGDKSGAVEHALRAKSVKRPEHEQPGYFSLSNMTLGIHALPGEYRRWLVNVDESFTEPFIRKLAFRIN